MEFIADYKPVIIKVVSADNSYAFLDSKGRVFTAGDK